MKNITILGSGPGGCAAAFAAARAGLEVTLVESHATGGTCLNTGCIPTKTLRSSAELLEKIHHRANFAISGTGEAHVDMPGLLARKNRVIQLLCGGIEKTCVELGVTLMRGQGRIVDSRRVVVTKADGHAQEIHGDGVIIATGSLPLNIPSLPVDHEYILNSDDALRLQRLPVSICIVGGGVIGCELACIFRAFGTAVTIIEGQGRLLPIAGVDAEMSKFLLREMKKKGIRVELNRTVREVRVENGGVRVAIATSDAELHVEAVFVTVGRAPNTVGLGLEEAGVALTPRGWVQADPCLETSVPGIWAIGDILGPDRIMLAHMASTEGERVVANIIGTKTPCAYDVVPSAIFTIPEIAVVGLSEGQARAKNPHVRSTLLHVRELGKAHAMNEIAGVFKLVHEGSAGRILGAHLCGAHSTELIAEATLALHLGATVEDIVRTIHAHPTLAEGFYELCHKAARQ